MQLLKLTAAIEAARAAVLGAPTTDIDTSAERSAQEGQEGASKGVQGQTVTARPSEPPEPRVVVRVPAPAPAPLKFADARAVSLLAFLSVGAQKVFDELHRLACQVAAARGYAVAPDTVALHLPQKLLAVRLKYTPRHLRRLLNEIASAGLLDWGAHASKVKGMGLWDGCLFAVKISENPDVVPHLDRAAWKHEWRDFEGDIEAGRTVKAFLEGMSSLHPEAQEMAVWDTLKAWSVSPGNVKTPLLCREDMPPDSPGRTPTMREIVCRLGELTTVHVGKRAATVGKLASQLADVLSDHQSRRYWCKVIWEAFRADMEGRQSLQGLAAMLSRLEADRAEWEGLRNPAALFASRLKASV